MTSLLSLRSLNEGFKDASKTKLDTLVAEYPNLKHFIYKLKKCKVRLTQDDLKAIWETSKKDTQVIARNLVKIGFFKDESESEDSQSNLLVPMIFRPALNIQYT